MKASVITPETGGQIHMVVGIMHETPENPIQTVTHECDVSAEEEAGEFIPVLLFLL